MSTNINIRVSTRNGLGVDNAFDNSICMNIYICVHIRISKILIQAFVSIQVFTSVSITFFYLMLLYQHNVMNYSSPLPPTKKPQLPLPDTYKFSRIKDSQVRRLAESQTRRLSEPMA